MELEVVLKGVLPSLAAALLLVSLGGARLAGLAAAIGTFVAFGLLKQWPAWPHELWQRPNGTQWLVWAVVAAGAWSTLESLRWLPAALRPLFAPLFAAFAIWLVLQKTAANWSFGDQLLFVGGGGGIAALTAATLRATLQRAPLGIAPAVLMAWLLSLDAGLLVLGKSALFGQVMGAVATTIGAAAGTRLWRQPFGFGEAHASWLAVAHAGFVLAGVHLAYLPWSAAGLALAAPLLPLLLGQRLTTQPFVWTLVSCGLVTLPLGGAMWLANGG